MKYFIFPAGIFECINESVHSALLPWSARLTEFVCVIYIVLHFMRRRLLGLSFELSGNSLVAQLSLKVFFTRIHWQETRTNYWQCSNEQSIAASPWPGEPGDIHMQPMLV